MLVNQALLSPCRPASNLTSNKCCTYYIHQVNVPMSIFFSLVQNIDRLCYPYKQRSSHFLHKQWSARKLNRHFHSWQYFEVDYVGDEDFQLEMSSSFIISLKFLIHWTTIIIFTSHIYLSLHASKTHQFTETILIYFQRTRQYFSVTIDKQVFKTKISSFTLFGHKRIIQYLKTWMSGFEKVELMYCFHVLYPELMRFVGLGFHWAIKLLLLLKH